VPKIEKKMDPERLCVELVNAELKKGVTSISAVGGNVFQNQALASCIKAKHGSFGAFIRSRSTEFSVSKDGTVKKLSFVPKKEKKDMPPKKPQTVVQVLEEKAVKQLQTMLKRGEANIGALGQALFLDEELAVAIRASHGSFGLFLRQRREFVVKGHLVSLAQKSSENVEVAAAPPVARAPVAVATVAPPTVKRPPLARPPVVKVAKNVSTKPQAACVVKNVVTVPGAANPPRAQAVPRKAEPKVDGKDNARRVKEKADSGTGKGHMRQQSLQLVSLDPPFPGLDGEWVCREEFDGSKSFGWFECRGCWRAWPSAHAWAMFNQRCQKCEIEFLPKFMWVNFGMRSEPEGESSESEDGPHDCVRCEACAKNKRCCRGPLFACGAVPPAAPAVSERNKSYEDYYEPADYY
jgi:hypothetical protein